MGAFYKSNSPGMCKGVEIFAPGTFNGKTWTLADLFEIVSNTPHLISLGILRPSLVCIGHEKDAANEQFAYSLLERTDLPKTGDVTNLRIVGDPRGEHCGHYEAELDCPDCQVFSVMMADFINLDPGIADIINRRAYDKVSAEIWNPLFYDGISYGLCLKGVSLLGGQLPAVKVLADIPLAVPMGESADFTDEVAKRAQRVIKDVPRGCQVSRSLFCFAEKRAMDRQAILQKLQELGFDVSQVTDAVPDVLLAEILRGLSEASTGGGGMEGEGGGAGDVSMNSNGGGAMSKEAMLAALADKSEEELRAMMGGGKKPDGGNMSAHAAAQAALRVQQNALRAQIARSQAQLRALQNQNSKRIAEERKAGFAAFSERLKMQGVPPAVFDAPAEGKPSLLDFYMQLDGSTLATFAEGAKPISPADAFLGIVESMVPHVKLAAKLKPNIKGGGGADTGESEIKEYFAAHADTMTEAGQTEEKMLKAWRAMRAANPEAQVSDLLKGR